MSMSLADFQEFCKNHRAKFNMGQPAKDGQDAASLLLQEMWTCIFGPSAKRPHKVECTVEELEEASTDIWLDPQRKEELQWSEHARLLLRALGRRYWERRRDREESERRQEEKRHEEACKANPPISGVVASFGELLAAQLAKVGS